MRSYQIQTAEGGSHSRHGNNPSVFARRICGEQYSDSRASVHRSQLNFRNHHPAKRYVCGADRPNISEPNNSLKVLRVITNGRWRCDMCFNHASTKAGCSSKFLNTHRLKQARLPAPEYRIHCQHRPATTKSQRDGGARKRQISLARGYKHWTSAVQLQNLIVAPYLARSWYVGASIIATRRKYRLIFGT